MSDNITLHTAVSNVNQTLGNSSVYLTNEPEMTLMLSTAAAITILSLVLAWLASFIVYGKSQSLRKVFPSTHNLIRAHIDYLMMATLLGVMYFSAMIFELSLPVWIIFLTCFGAVYNPFGFIVKAINPKAGTADTLANKLLVHVGFLPVTIGFGYTMVMILSASMSL